MSKILVIGKWSRSCAFFSASPSQDFGTQVAQNLTSKPKQVLFSPAKILREFRGRISLI